MLKHYLTASGHPSRLDNHAQNHRTAAGAAVVAAEMFRNDLRAKLPEIQALCAGLAEAGSPLTAVRLLEILVWTQTEKNGYYRSIGSA